jgi:hypothetical protein
MASISQPAPPPVRRWRSDPITRISTLTPFALAIYIDLFARPYFGVGMASRQPELLGMSAGAWLQIAFLSWAAVGAWVVWTTHSRLKSAIALVLCTPVAIFGLILGPAVILILHSLGS